MSNPSKSCVDQLYEFLENKNLPIDEDGDFYAYKAVKSNWMDKHSGTISNKIGETVEIARNKVDDNPRNDCSYGLHVGSIEYVRGFGNPDDKYVIVKVNPADAVAVPSYDTRKMRCCKYIVVEEFVDALPSTTYKPDVDEDEECNDDTDDICGDCHEETISCICDEEVEVEFKYKAEAMDRKQILTALVHEGIEFCSKSNTEALRRKLIKDLT